MAAYKCQISKDAANGRILMKWLDAATLLDVAGLGAIELSLYDLGGNVPAGQPVPRLVLAPVDGVTDDTGAAVQGDDGAGTTWPLAFLLVPDTFTPPFAVAGGTGNMRWRGLWVFTDLAAVPPVLPADGLGAYDKNDVVILQAGTATGTYISTLDKNVNAPDTGIGWIQLGTTTGQWQ